MSCDLIQLANPGVASLQPYQPGKPMDELERELGISNIIKLASNENPYGPGKAALAVLENPGDLSRYPDGNGFRLKSALARYHDIRPDQITLGNGSNEILELIARAVLSASHEVVFSEHAFAVYPLVTQAMGARASTVPAVNWGHDTAGFLRAITEHTRIIFIANPNNPTGTWLKKNNLRPLLEAIPENIIVVLDEAYCDYVTDPDYPDGIKWLPDFPNLLVTRTFSKAYGLAGLRVGYALGSREVADLMNRVRQPFNVNSVAQAGAVAALADQDFVQRSHDLNAQGMAQLTEGFRTLGITYIPSFGNFVSFRIGDARRAYQRMLERGVIVRPIGSYGLPAHLRVSVGLPDENERFLKALQGVLRDGGPAPSVETMNS